MENEEMNFEENQMENVEVQTLVPSVEVIQTKKHKDFTLGAIVGATTIVVGRRIFGFFKKKIAAFKEKNQTKKTSEETTDEE